MRYIYTSIFLLITIFESCVDKAEPEIHLIPSTIKGPIVIIYDQKMGVPEKYEGEYRLYEIPRDGVLRTQFKHPKGFIPPGKIKYYYNDKNGRQSITYLETTKVIKDDGKIHAFNVESSGSTIRYLVGYIQEGDNYFNQLHRKIEELFPPVVQ